MDKMMELSWKQLLLPQLLLSPGVAAYLDWSTGILRINSSFEEWDELSSRTQDGTRVPQNLSSRELTLIETVTHETAHFLQIVTTGFLYSLSAKLYLKVAEWVADATKDSPHDTQASLQALATTDIPAHFARDAKAILSSLDTLGPREITVRSIVESGALLTQKRTHLIDLTAERYIEVLDSSSPSKEYRHAYDVAFEYLGLAAFDLFPLIVFFSLCTARPEQVFSGLCQETARRYSSYGSSPKVIHMSHFAEALSGLSAETIGTAAEAAVSLPEHPVYTEIVRRLNQLHAEGKISLDRYMITPHDVQNELILHSLRPMVFNRTSEKNWPIALPPDLWPNVPEEDRSAHAMNLVIFAAVYSRVLSQM
jgi:hypothetical protein